MKQVVAILSWLLPVAAGAWAIASKGDVSLLLLLCIGGVAGLAGVFVLVVGIKDRRVLLIVQGLIGSVAVAALLMGVFALFVVQRRNAGEAALAEAKRRLTADSTRDATQPIVDEDFRFELGWPGDGWKLLDEAEMRRANGFAVAGAMGPSGVWGAIIFEEADEQEQLDAFARRAVGQVVRKESGPEPISFRGRQAIEHVTVERVGGLMRYRRIFLRRGSWIMQISSWGPLNVATDSAMGPFFSSVRLLDGELVGRKAAAPPIARAEGVGWTVNDGTYVHALHGFELEPQEGWQLQVAGDLDYVDSSAVVGVTHIKPSIQLTITVEHALGTTRKAYLDVLARRGGLEPTDSKSAHTVLGAPFEVVRSSWGGDEDYEMLRAIVGEADRFITVTATYLRNQKEAVEPVLAAGLAGIRRLSADEVEALRSALEGRKHPHAFVGESMSLRNGVLRNVAVGYRVRVPGGFWRVMRPAEAGTDGAVLSNDDIGVWADIRPSSTFTEDARKHVEALSERYLTHGQTEPQQLEVAGRSAWFVAGEQRFEDDLTRHQRIASIPHPGSALEIVVGTTAADPELLDHAFAQILGAIDFDVTPLAEMDLSGPVYRDERYGYAIDVTGTGMKISATDTAFGELLSNVGAAEGQRGLNVTAVTVPFHDEEWSEALMEQGVRTRLIEHFKKAGERRRIVWRDQRARLLEWRNFRQRHRVLLVTRSGVHYMLQTFGPPAEDLKKLEEHFQLLD